MMQKFKRNDRTEIYLNNYVLLFVVVVCL